MKSLVCILSACMTLAVANAYIIMDSQGFEGYTLGSIHNQNSGYWNPGCTGAKAWVQRGGDPDFDVYGEIVNLDGHGRVLKINNVGTPWLSSLRADLKFLGNGSGYPEYSGKEQLVTVSFDLFVSYSGDDLVDGAFRTYRNSYATLQSEYWVGTKMNDEPSIKAYMSNSPTTGAVNTNVGPYGLGQWHNITFTQKGLNNVRQACELFVDGVKKGDFYTVWGGYAGYMSNVDIVYNITGQGEMYIDNFKVLYMEVPEPATLSILSLGSLVMLRRRFC